MKAACIGLLAVAAFAVMFLVSVVLGLSGMWGWWLATLLLATGLVAVALYAVMVWLIDGDQPSPGTNYSPPRQDRHDTPAQPLHPQAFVYFIENQTGHVKIGWSKDPIKRLKALQTGSSEPLTMVYAAGFLDEADARYCEGLLHRHLAARCVHGEWFMAEGIDYERLVRTLDRIARLDHVD